MFGMYSNEGYGAAKISTILNKEGFKTKRGSMWSQNAVARILRNELYAGKIINGKEEITDFLTGVRKAKNETEWMVIDRPDLQIIEPELFQKAQDTLVGRHTAFNISRERQSNKHIFSTLIKCDECGYSYRRTIHTYKNTYVRWVCSGRNAKGASSCQNKNTVDEQNLIDSLHKYFVDILSRKNSIMQHITREFAKLYKTKDDNENYEIELRNRLSKMQKKRQKFMDMYTDDLISREELREKMERLNTDIYKAENELKPITYNLNKGSQLEDLLRRTFGAVEDIVSMNTITNAQLKQIIKKIIVTHDGNVDIYLHLFGDFGLDRAYQINDN